MGEIEQRAQATGSEIDASERAPAVGGARRIWTAPEVIVSTLAETDKLFNPGEFPTSNVGPS